MTIPATCAIVALALAVDRIAGEPAWLWRRLPHPVVVFGAGIAALEMRWNRPSLPPARRRAAGALALGAMIAAGAGTGCLLDAAIGRSGLGLAAQAAIASVLLAQKSLVDHVAAVGERVAARDLAGARAAVALIVGRDVAVLDEAGVARAAIESAAENFSDGLVAPAVWLALLGLPGLIAFKIVSTADSMIGHRSERYAAYGWAAARLDDALNIVPARLSALLIAAVAALAGMAGANAVTTALRDAGRHKSPNAGWPEAAAAGALGLALGGPRRYGEAEVAGAWLNPAGRASATEADMRRALRLIDAAWALLTLLAAALTVLWLARQPG